MRRAGSIPAQGTSLSLSPCPGGPGHRSTKPVVGVQLLAGRPSAVRRLNTNEHQQRGGRPRIRVLPRARARAGRDGPGGDGRQDGRVHARARFHQGRARAARGAPREARRRPDEGRSARSRRWRTSSSWCARAVQLRQPAPTAMHAPFASGEAVGPSNPQGGLDPRTVHRAESWSSDSAGLKTRRTWGSTTSAHRLLQRVVFNSSTSASGASEPGSP